MIDSEDKTMPAAKETLKRVSTSRLLFNTGLFVVYFGRGLAFWLYLIFGTLLALKITLPKTGVAVPLLSFWLAFSFLPILLFVLFFTYKGRYSRLDAAAWLDLRSQGGGAIIAAVEESPSETQSATPAMRVRPVLGFWRGVRPLLFPILFGIVVAFVPWKAQPAHLVASLDRRAEVVAARVTRAKKLGFVTDIESRTFEQQLGRAKEAGRQAPEAAAESIDTIDKQLNQSILKSAKLSRKAIDAATRLLAEARIPNSKGLPSAAAEFEKTLDAIIKRRVYNRMIAQSLQRLAKQRGMTGLSSMEEMAASLTPLENLDLEQLRAIAHALQNGQIMMLDKAALAEGLLSGRAAKAHLALLTAGIGQGKQGSGGVDRGPGTVPLELGETKDTKEMRFKPIPMKKGDTPLFPGALLGKRRISGGTEPPPEFRPPARSDVLFDGIEGGAARTSTLGPRSKAVTSRYFTEEISDE